MATSDEDLQKQAQVVSDLREQVDEAEALRAQRELETANDVTMTELQAEEARLRARLARAKDASKVASVKAGADAPLQAAKDALTAAVEQQRAAEATPTEKETGVQVATSASPEEVAAAVDGSGKNGGNN